MGNDGGSIPTRRELVKEAARNPTTTQLKQSRQEKQEHDWTTDPISHKPLAQPIVSDSQGKLYNKDTLLEYLVEGTRKEDGDLATEGSVKSLKDVVEVKFEVEGSLDAKTNGASKQYWKCPVTGDRLEAGSKAVYLVPCGHAFCGTAIKEISGEKCLTCETPYASNDIIPILPILETDIARLILRAKALQENGLTHSLKKASGGGKKRKKRDEASTATTDSLNSTADASDKIASPRNGTPVNGASDKNNVSGINDSSTASLTARVMQEQELVKKRKTNNANVSSLFSSNDASKPSGKSGDFMTRGFSIANGGKG